MAFKTCHDLVQTNFASFSPHSVSSFSSLCKWNQFSMPCLAYSLPCLMLFLLNVMFLSLMCNDFWASRQGYVPDDSIFDCPSVQCSCLICTPKTLYLHFHWHPKSCLLEEELLAKKFIADSAFSILHNAYHIILYSAHAQKIYFKGIDE